MSRTYYAPHGGHPGQDQILTDRAIFTNSYAVLPKGTMRDIVTSFLPGWTGTRLWIIARPMSGFAETFSQYIMEVQPGGGSDAPEVDPDATLRSMSPHADRVPEEIEKNLPRALDAMGSMAEAMEKMMPALKDMAERMKDVAPPAE